MNNWSLFLPKPRPDLETVTNIPPAHACFVATGGWCVRFLVVMAGNGRHCRWSRNQRKMTRESPLNDAFITVLVWCSRVAASTPSTSVSSLLISRRPSFAPRTSLIAVWQSARQRYKHMRPERLGTCQAGWWWESYRSGLAYALCCHKLASRVWRVFVGNCTLARMLRGMCCRCSSPVFLHSDESTANGPMRTRNLAGLPLLSTFWWALSPVWLLRSIDFVGSDPLQPESTQPTQINHNMDSATHENTPRTPPIHKNTKQQKTTLYDTIQRNTIQINTKEQVKQEKTMQDATIRHKTTRHNATQGQTIQNKTSQDNTQTLVAVFRPKKRLAALFRSLFFSVDPF